MLVRCKKCKTDEKKFTEGKIYEVTDIDFRNDRGFNYSMPGWSVEGIILFLSLWYEFEIVDKNDHIGITKVVFNNPATIVFFADGTKTVVKCSENDVWDAEKGLAMAIVKHMTGNTGKFNDIFKEWLKDGNSYQP